VLKFFFVFFILFFTAASGKPIDLEKKQLLQKAGYEITLMPDKATESLDYLEKNFILTDDEREKSDYLRIKSLYYQNNLTDALKKISANNNDLPISIFILKRSILNYLSISTNGVSAPKKTSQNKDLVFSDEIILLLTKLNQNRTNNLNNNLLAVLEKAKSSNLMILRDDILSLFDYVATNKLSDQFLIGIRNLYKNDIEFDIVYSQFLLNNDNLEKAKKIILSLPKEQLEQSSNPKIKYEYYDLLASYYSKIGDSNNFSDSINKKQDLLKKIDQAKYSAKNKWFNISEEKNNDDLDLMITKRKNIILTIVIIGLISVTLILLRFYQTNFHIKEYQNFINKINALKDKKTPQTQTITEKTENLLLKKLDDFENTDDCINPDISLQSLAKKLETNTKYLSEAINNHKQKNFNAYINELRINYIIGKLKNKPIYRSYKIKYLAEESGFSTHSAFAAVFKSVTGMSPANYIQLLKQKEE